ncbi:MULTISPECIES: NAD-dependent epimerase/dehydratase family protein [unclassified Halomonas]|uniref:NAD-dependent epimerase/dehydratase family protein n=1 Tax=unclassified Halomonas TaxID=2609666 RepID=UPI001CF3AD6B|nr:MULTISPECIES: NAD-dependent epimerase/dehydratase family protein [unclassified Halomonas]MCA8866655.1 NAD-dependent epimerase/dehydratase family protein [Halomonas sp. SBBP1]UZH11418.1 GDP-mannose 4,6-dehydratase [Halomonas sp. BDJS001]
MSTCLVTGGSGFTGRHLIAHLKHQGHRVVALASQPCGADETHRIDINDQVALSALVSSIAPQQVYHLAALSFVGHPTPLDFYRVNVLGTEALLQALGKLPEPPQILLASSANVYGANGQAVIDENVPPAPVNHYANSKMAMECIARTYAERLPIIIARPFNYTGPGQAEHFLVPKIVQHIKQRANVIELGNIHVSRDFSDVRDIVAVYHRLLKQWPAQAISGSIINVGSGEAVSLKMLIHKLQILGKHTLEVRVNPAFVRSSEIPELKASTQRLNAWVPDLKRFSLDDTLAAMLEAAPTEGDRNG